MQVFLPYPEFRKSLACLDYKRLGKQRVECLQILIALTHNKGWVHHPAVKMFKGYSQALVSYGLTCCELWRNSGHLDTCYDKILAFQTKDPIKMPFWLGDPAFHDSHKSNLLRKHPEFYGRYNWQVPDDLPYVWPV
jgi:hypothetical protein